MKKIIIVNMLIAFFFTACSEREKITIGETVTPVLSTNLSNTTIVIEEATLENDFCQFSWNAADFGFESANSEYTLWMDVQGNDFAEAISLVTNTDLSFSISNADMNQKLLGLGGTPGNPLSVEFKLTSTLSDQLNTESNSLALTITPLEVVIEYPKLYVPGDQNSWNFPEDDLLYSVNRDDIYEGYIYFDNPALLFKLSFQPNWDDSEAIIGDPDASGTSGTLQIGSWGGNNIYVTGGVGYYRVKANLKNLNYSLDKTDWGISGDFNGWSNTVMTYDAANDTWSYTGDVTAGEIKFIANGEWNIYYGGSANEGILENPGDNISIPEDGNYTITLNLSEAIYKYTITKN